MTIKVKSSYHPSDFRKAESGIRRVVEAYFKYLPDYDIELVDKDATTYDLMAAHAGMTGSDVDVAHIHGLYWGDDLQHWQRESNRQIVEAVRNARSIIVPSEWVAETFRRDMRINPYVLPHGIDYEEWDATKPIGKYVLWNKNRPGDVCSPEAVGVLADHFNRVQFASTFSPTPKRKNIEVLGVQPHSEMKDLVEHCGVYLSTAKETFGIGVLEALAAGRPVLGWRWGGNVDIVKHGVNGYLAEPGNYEDLVYGLEYCMRNAKTLGENGREMVKQWDWLSVIKKLATIYSVTNYAPCDRNCAIVIPVYNKPIEQIKRAVESAINQNINDSVLKIIIVNDGSTEDYISLKNEISEKVKHIAYPERRFLWIDKPNGGVATARNAGIEAAIGYKYICCLDADDYIEPNFVQILVRFLEDNPTYGMAYTGLTTHIQETGAEQISQWPGAFDYDRQINYEKRQNQVPTCCVFRRDAWKRLGGFRQRYAPYGAGSEDAALWSAIGSIGFNGYQVTPKGLFHYTAFEGNVSGNPEYQEKDWLAWYPWSRDGKHPFVSVATPENTAHIVREYDQPLISIIVPVGPGHTQYLVDLIDSVEAQYLREWEIIVVFDDDKQDVREIEKVLTPYPFIRQFYTAGGEGAGAARNIGAKHARGNFLLFIDADDMLNVNYPEALSRMINEYKKTGSAVYTNSIGRAFLDDPSKLDPVLQQNIIGEIKGEYFIQNRIVEYNRDLAIQQPKLDGNNQVYLWCYISTLIPRQWHIDIGGFDESLETWEDVEYFWRLAKAGKCFVGIEEPYLIYRFYSGTRREAALQEKDGRQIWQTVVDYITSKHKDIEIMPCNCGNNKVVKTVIPAVAQQKETDMADSEYILIEFHFEGEQTRSYYGRPLKSPSGLRGPDGRILDYGGHSRKSGDHFYVHVDDQKIKPHMFVLVKEEIPERRPDPVEDPKPIKEVSYILETEAPTRLIDPVQDYATITDEDILQLENIPGISEAILEELQKAGLTSGQKILEAGLTGLTKVKGIGKAKATQILEYISE